MLGKCYSQKTVDEILIMYIYPTRIVFLHTEMTFSSILGPNFRLVLHQLMMFMLTIHIFHLLPTLNISGPLLKVNLKPSAPDFDDMLQRVVTCIPYLISKLLCHIFKFVYLSAIVRTHVKVFLLFRLLNKANIDDLK